jgi:hypothetical protein
VEPGSGHIKPGSSLLGGSHARREADEFDRAESRRSSQMSSTTGDVDMEGAESMEHSDEDRSLTRPSLANFRYVNLGSGLSRYTFSPTPMSLSSFFFTALPPVASLTVVGLFSSLHHTLPVFF